MFNATTFLQNLNPLMQRESAQFANIIVWGLKSTAASRNSGFMWEPGAFAAMLLFPIYIQFQSNGFKIDKQIIILIIALLTTISTMGYIGFLLILFVYQLNNKKKTAILMLPLILVAAFFIFQLDFVSYKVQDEIERQDEIEAYVYSKRKDFASLGRIGSLKADFNDWKEDPIIGRGGHNEVYMAHIGKVINRTNGLSRFLLFYGIVGIYIYFRGVYLSFYSVSENKKKLNALIAVSLLLVLSFSNELLAKPLFFSFAIIYLVDRTKSKLDFSKYKLIK
jgi:hypothetical protein